VPFFIPVTKNQTKVIAIIVPDAVSGQSDIIVVFFERKPETNKEREDMTTNAAVVMTTTMTTPVATLTLVPKTETRVENVDFKTRAQDAKKNRFKRRYF
jgi:hypothetical protein